jgi:hypothetical protein
VLAEAAADGGPRLLFGHVALQVRRAILRPCHRHDNRCSSTTPAFRALSVLAALERRAGARADCRFPCAAPAATVRAALSLFVHSESDQAVAEGSFTGKDPSRVEHAWGLLARCYSLWLIGAVQDLACVLRVVRADHDVVRSNDA